MIFLFTIFFKELDSTFGGTIFISREAITKFDLICFFFLGGFGIFGLVLCLKDIVCHQIFFYFFIFYLLLLFLYKLYLLRDCLSLQR